MGVPKNKKVFTPELLHIQLAHSSSPEVTRLFCFASWTLDHHSVDNHILLLSYGPTYTAINNVLFRAIANIY